jgi:hypothetical protein
MICLTTLYCQLSTFCCALYDVRAGAAGGRRGRLGPLQVRGRGPAVPEEEGRRGLLVAPILQKLSQPRAQGILPVHRANDVQATHADFVATDSSLPPVVQDCVPRSS